MTATEENRGKAVVILSGSGAVLLGRSEESILDILHDHDLQTEGVCGGRGTCGKCAIRFVVDPPPSTPEDEAHISPSRLHRGWRLACRHVASDRAEIELPMVLKAVPTTQDESSPIRKISNPLVTVEAVPPGEALDPPRSYEDRLRGLLGEGVSVLLPALRELGEVGEPAQVLEVVRSGDEVLGVRADATVPVCGVSVDVGTTTLEASLFSLPEGRELGSAMIRNPQVRFGADVISRIAHVRASGSEGLANLHTSVASGLNLLFEELCGRTGLPRESVYMAVVVGNSTMLHLLLGADVTGIGESPFTPVFLDRQSRLASEIGLQTAPLARVRTLPAISAFVGSDIVAGILSTGFAEQSGRRLFLDIGTNGEIVLASGGRLLACSTAAGPAFEGASIQRGMAAKAGAIESIRIAGGHVHCSVIGDVSPLGLCGTGLVSAVAELIRAGVIDVSGRLRDIGGPLGTRLVGEGPSRCFRLTTDVDPVSLYQEDIRQFQLGKAAIRAGIESMLGIAGLAASDLEDVLIGGAFSSRLSADDLITTGLLPSLDCARVRVLGNTAKKGAMLALLDRSCSAEATSIAKRVQLVELSTEPRFRKRFVEHIHFPRSTREHGP